jgi:hypothetical protein
MIVMMTRHRGRETCSLAGFPLPRRLVHDRQRLARWCRYAHSLVYSFCRPPLIVPQVVALPAAMVHCKVPSPPRLEDLRRKYGLMVQGDESPASSASPSPSPVPVPVPVPVPIRIRAPAAKPPAAPAESLRLQPASQALRAAKLPAQVPTSPSCASTFS